MHHERGWWWRLGPEIPDLRGTRTFWIILFTLGLLCGCAKTVKGPVGQGDKGVGLKVPVLDLLKKDTYKPESLSPDNIDPGELNPTAGQKEKVPDSDPFTRYDESMN